MIGFKRSIKFTFFVKTGHDNTIYQLPLALVVIGNDLIAGEYQNGVIRSRAQSGSGSGLLYL